MVTAVDQTGGMGKLSKQTRKIVDEELKDRELDLLKRTDIDWESIRPQVSDEESFNKLIEVVNAATANNESIAMLKERIISFGKGVIDVAKEVLKLI